MSGVAEPRVRDGIWPSPLEASPRPVPEALPPSPSASPPGLALMMQLAQELKTLARDLGLAVVVRKWAQPAVLLLSRIPGLHQVGT